MDDNPQIVIQSDRYAFSNAPHFANGFSFDVVDRRIDRSHDERVRNANLFKCPSRHVRRDRFDVDGYIRQLRQDSRDGER